MYALPRIFEKNFYNILVTGIKPFNHNDFIVATLEKIFWWIVQ
jgi:hypothetical protein